MKISVIYSNSSKKDNFTEDVGVITVLLQKFGSVSISTGFGLLVFALDTPRRCEEVEKALNELNLMGKFTVNQKVEEEDVDQYRT